jgi:hypothetical protein
VNGQRFVSHRYPYLPIRILVADREFAFEAMVDTRFEGSVPIPDDAFGDRVPDLRITWLLADNSRIESPAYRGLVNLAGFTARRAVIGALGSEAIVGRALIG